MQKLIVLLALLFFPALAYAQGFGSPNGVGFPSNGSGSGGGLTSPVGISDGGTGQTTKAAGFNALSPLTTQGDILYGGASGAGTRLAKGTALQILRTNAGATAPEWATPAWQIGDGGTGLSSFTGGDTLYYASGTLLSKLAKGTAGQFYQMNSGATAPQWSSMSGDATMAAGGATTLATVNSNVGSFTNSSITVNAKGLVTAASSGSAGLTNPMTTTGDIIYSSDGSGTPARLAIGSPGKTLEVNSAGTAPQWGYRDFFPAAASTPRRTPYLYCSPSFTSSTTLTNVGGSTPTIVGTASAAQDTDGRWVNWATAASTNSYAALHAGAANPIGRFDHLPVFVTRIKLDASTITNMRLWCGLSSSLLQATATPTTQSTAAFGYDSGIDGSVHLYAVTCDGASGVTRSDTGVSVTTSGVYDLAIDARSSPYLFYVNGALTNSISTNLPSSTATFYMFDSLTTLTNTAINLRSDCVGMTAK